MSSLTPLKTFSICSSSSVRSVIKSTRESVTCSRIHLASQTMVRLLPLPCVCQMMPPSRRLTCRCAARTPKYWLWRQAFFVPASKTMKSWTISSSRSLRQSCPNSRSKRVVARRRQGIGFLPAEPVLLRRLDQAVAQPLGFVAGHDELDRGEERPDELLLLVVEVLADALGHRHGRPLQFQHAQRDAVDVQHDVRPLGVLAR